MNRTPEFPKNKGRTLKPGIFNEDMNKNEERKSLSVKKSEDGGKEEIRRKKNLENMKKLRIELDKQIEVKEKIIRDSLLSDKNLDKKINCEIFGKLQISGKTMKDSEIGSERNSSIRNWIEEQKGKELKTKYLNMVKTPVRSKESLAVIPEVKRSSTPTPLSHSSNTQQITKTITRQISNTIQKAREIRRIISKSPVPNN